MVGVLFTLASAYVRARQTGWCLSHGRRKAIIRTTQIAPSNDSCCGKANNAFLFCILSDPVCSRGTLPDLGGFLGLARHR